MGYTVAQKLIKSHLVSGEMKVGSEVGLKIDQTQQVSRSYIFLVELQTPFQTGNGSGKITHLRFLQSFVIKKVGNPSDPLQKRHIRTAARTVVNG